MPNSNNYYESLEVSPQATTAEIKQAYRRLVKRFHPDSNNSTANHEQIVIINAAYEILKDPQHRYAYDQQLFSRNTSLSSSQRQQRSADAQNRYWRERKSGQEADQNLAQWFKEVYEPVNRLVGWIIESLDTEIDYLSADPFDDQLMAAFQSYLQQCRDYLKQAQTAFAALPNPAKVAGTAANLYYCLNQIGDGIDELEWFTLNYDEHYLHTGKELFRVATSLRWEAQESISAAV